MQIKYHPNIKILCDTNISTDDTLTMRLNGNPTKNATVEIYDDFGTWGPICSLGWNLNAAQFICRHFGYETALGALQIPIQAIRPKMLQVKCESKEYASLLECNTETSVLCLCNNYEAGVVCSTGEILYITILGTVRSFIDRFCLFVCFSFSFCFLFFVCLFLDNYETKSADSSLILPLTEKEKSIAYHLSSWKYVFHPHLRQTYVLVTRLPGEHIWRKICVPLDLNLNQFYFHIMLCNELIKPTEALEKDDNISSSEVWLAQMYRTLRLDNVAEGSCFQFGRKPLMLTRCFHTKGKKCMLTNYWV